MLESFFFKKFRAMSSTAAFTQKLHLIYLINDLLHHWLVDQFLIKNNIAMGFCEGKI